MLVLTNFIAGVGWAISGKSDAATVQVLACIVGLIGIASLLCGNSLHFEQLGLPEPRWYPRVVRCFNRFFKVVHAVFSMLFATGAITLALQFRYENP